jgi:RNA polymerase sigma factor (sigma-70 family)
MNTLIERGRVFWLRHACLQGVPHDEREDLVQELCREIPSTLSQLTHPDAFWSFYNQRLRWAVSNYRKRQHTVSLDEAYDEDDSSKARYLMDGTTLSPEASLLQKERCARVWQAVEDLYRLKPRHAEVVDAYYFEEGSVATIAEAMGVPAGTVGRWLHEARGWLRVLLGDI